MRHRRLCTSMNLDSFYTTLRHRPIAMYIYLPSPFHAKSGRKLCWEQWERTERKSNWTRQTTQCQFHAGGVGGRFLVTHEPYLSGTTPGVSRCELRRRQKGVGRASLSLTSLMTWVRPREPLLAFSFHLRAFRGKRFFFPAVTAPSSAVNGRPFKKIKKLGGEGGCFQSRKTWKS